MLEKVDEYIVYTGQVVSANQNYEKKIGVELLWAVHRSASTLT